ncbi:MAG: rhomboid family intramembrane serine protease [Marinosulfonomonas sp.]
MFPIRDHNPSQQTPIVTIALIFVNIAIFAGSSPSLSNPQALGEFWNSWAMIPAHVAKGQDIYTLGTSMFLHGGIMHIGGNMLFLWIFGDNLEEEFGHVGFLLFYLACGVLAGLAQVLADAGSTVPTVGASGAIAGVMGGYLLLFPKARVDVLIIIIFIFKVFPLPAWVMLGLWFALQLFSGVSVDTSGGGVAYWAHAGGFAFGLTLTLPAWLRHGGPAYWRKNQGHPPHPDATYKTVRTHIPKVRRR